MMEEPHKQEDLEKGQPLEDTPRPSISRGISNIFSKAGEGIASAITKAGEGIHTTGTTVKDGTKSAGGGLTSPIKTAGEDNPETDTKKKEKEKARKDDKHQRQAKQEKNFEKNYKPIPHEEPKDTNIVGNITKLLPANTFLMFQTLAPLATNEGHCGRPEVIMTSTMLIILAFTCMLVCFTDTIQCNGKVYHGLVTRRGLWNPSFKSDPSFKYLHKYENDLAEFYNKRKQRREYKQQLANAEEPGTKRPKGPMPEKHGDEPLKPTGPYVMRSTFSSGNSQYKLQFTDVLHAVLSAVAFATLTMLTSPVSTCFYPNIPGSVVKTLPLLVGFVVSAIFAFSPPARNGIAHPLSPRAPSQVDVAEKPSDQKGLVHEQLTGAAQAVRGKSDHGQVNPKVNDDK